MLKDIVHLKENSSIYLASIDKVGKRNLAIMIKDIDQPKYFKQVYEIPEPRFLEEVDGISKTVKLVYSYYDKDKRKYILEQFQLDPGDRNPTIFGFDRYITDDACYRINQGVYLYQSSGKTPYLYTAWNKKFDIGVLNDINNLENFTFSFPPEIRSSNSDMLELDLQLGKVETIETIVKLPTEAYGDFMISKHFYSSMDDEFYVLPTKEEKTFIAPQYFASLFNQTNLASKIQKKTQEKKDSQIEHEKTFVKKMKNIVNQDK